MILVHSAAALTAVYRISEDGRSFSAEVELEDAESYLFYELGLLGERVPVEVREIALESRDGGCDPCSFTQQGSLILFERGNYTLHYSQDLHDNHFLAAFDRPYEIVVILPQGFDVRNRLIGSMSPGAEVSEENGSIVLRWNDTRMAECRFYEPFREFLLMVFFTVLGVVAIVLLVPLILTGRRRG